MPIRPKDTALNEAMRLDFTASHRVPPADDLCGAVVAALGHSPEPLSVCVAVFDLTDLPTGTYCLDGAGFLHRTDPKPPHLLAHHTIDVAILLGGLATASPADFRRLGLAAGVVSRHLTTRLGSIFRDVACDDKTIAWPLQTVNAAMTHLTTITGRQAR